METNDLDIDCVNFGANRFNCEREGKVQPKVSSTSSLLQVSWRCSDVSAIPCSAEYFSPYCRHPSAWAIWAAAPDFQGRWVHRICSKSLLTAQRVCYMLR